MTWTPLDTKFAISVIGWFIVNDAWGNAVVPSDHDEKMYPELAVALRVVMDVPESYQEVDMLTVPPLDGFTPVMSRYCAVG